jgi:hypothetical protein
MLSKRAKVRLTGKTLAQLNLDIHERDNYTCIVPGCDTHVPLDEKFHHDPCGSYKEDIIEKGCLLCYYHHQLRDSRKHAEKIKGHCHDYLSGLYPDVWECIYAY